MTTLRPDYDTLFVDQMLKSISADPHNKNYTGIADGLKNYGFFGFISRGNCWDNSQLAAALNHVMRALSSSDPTLATQIFEAEFRAMGIQRAADLMSRCDIAYDVKHLFFALKFMITDIEDKYAQKKMAESETDPDDFVTLLSDRNVPLRFYPDLIFSAETFEDKESIRRLFAICPVDFIGYELLRSHQHFNQENFDLLTPRVVEAQNERWRVSTRAISLALQGQLNVQKLVELEKPDRLQWSANLQLATLCGQDLSTVVFSGFGECLTECVLNSEVAVGLMLGVIQEHLDATPRGQRTEALTSQLFAIRKAFNNLTFLVNHEMAINLFSVAVTYAHQDPKPLLEILEYCDAIDQTKGHMANSRDNKFAMMLKFALFNTPKSLAAVDVLGLFGRHALERLLRSRVATLAPDGNVLFHSPNIKAYSPELKKKVATFALKCLATEFITLLDDSNLTRHEAQAMVDAELFSEQDWLWISGSTTAATNIARAQLPTHILEIVGDQVLEMALGNDLGL